MRASTSQGTARHPMIKRRLNKRKHSASSACAAVNHFTCSSAREPVPGGCINLKSNEMFKIAAPVSVGNAPGPLVDLVGVLLLHAVPVCPSLSLSLVLWRV
jgi:hypothetical protein